jgi:hypothetical protein
MKPPSPLRFPETTPATSLHGAPVRWLRCSARFPKPIIEAGARCSLQLGLRSARFPERIVDREEVSCAADFAAPTRFPERSSATRRTGRPYSASNTSSFQFPGSTVRALRHGLLELVMPAIFAQFPERRSPTSLRAVRA